MTNCDNCGQNMDYQENWYEVEYGPEAFGLRKFICEKCYETTDLTIYVEQKKIVYKASGQHGRHGRHI